MVAYRQLKEIENFKPSAPKLVYERWSLTRGSEYSDLSEWGNFGSVPLGGRLREVVAQGGSTVYQIVVTYLLAFHKILLHTVQRSYTRALLLLLYTGLHFGMDWVRRGLQDLHLIHSWCLRSLPYRDTDKNYQILSPRTGLHFDKDWNHTDWHVTRVLSIKMM